MNAHTRVGCMAAHVERILPSSPKQRHAPLLRFNACVFFSSLMENEQLHLGGNEQVTAREKRCLTSLPTFFFFFLRLHNFFMT